MVYHVKDLQGEQYQLLQDSQDINAVMENIGIKQYDCGFLIVETGEGEYKQVYSSEQFMPYLNTELEKIL